MVWAWVEAGLVNSPAFRWSFYGELYSIALVSSPNAPRGKEQGQISCSHTTGEALGCSLPRHGAETALLSARAGWGRTSSPTVVTPGPALLPCNLENSLKQNKTVNQVIIRHKITEVKGECEESFFCERASEYKGCGVCPGLLSLVPKR